jgi:hypothetical protein
MERYHLLDGSAEDLSYGGFIALLQKWLRKNYAHLRRFT